MAGLSTLSGAPSIFKKASIFDDDDELPILSSDTPSSKSKNVIEKVKKADNKSSLRSSAPNFPGKKEEEEDAESLYPKPRGLVPKSVSFKTKDAGSDDDATSTSWDDESGDLDEDLLSGLAPPNWKDDKSLAGRSKSEPPKPAPGLSSSFATSSSARGPNVDTLMGLFKDDPVNSSVDAGATDAGLDVFGGSTLPRTSSRRPVAGRRAGAGGGMADTSPDRAR